MSTTGTQMITKVRQRLADTTNSTFGTDELLKWINDGSDEFAATTGVISTTANITTDAATFTFDLLTSLSNYLNVFTVAFAGVPLDFAPRHEIHTVWGEDTGTPLAWSVWGDVLYIDLKASTASGSSALNAFYTRTPTLMTAVGNTFDFPATWEYAVVAYACYRAHDSKRETGLAERARAEFDVARQAAAKVTETKLTTGGYG